VPKTAGPNVSITRDLGDLDEMIEEVDWPAPFGRLSSRKKSNPLADLPYFTRRERAEVTSMPMMGIMFRHQVPASSDWRRYACKRLSSDLKKGIFFLDKWIEL
jgi:hypothetical protein